MISPRPPIRAPPSRAWRAAIFRTRSCRSVHGSAATSSPNVMARGASSSRATRRTSARRPAGSVCTPASRKWSISPGNSTPCWPAGAAPISSRRMSRRGVPGLCVSADGTADWRPDLGPTSPNEQSKMDYGYDASPICVPDESGERPAAARPGARAPHAWLADGRSTIDLFGDGFVLVRFGEAPGTALIDAARGRGVPLCVVAIDDPAIAALFGAALVLVRPDGHVAWRGDRSPADAEAVVDRLRGALSNEVLRQHGPRPVAVEAS